MERDAATTYETKRKSALKKRGVSFPIYNHVTGGICLVCRSYS